ncbi:uncharacterized protein LOC127877802 [Dreissena polymorpha]|uniref:Uncharacterized protein n=1 Tax=Dreissena polymorpha TaxID=45954 RepID=A0A9D4QRB0_DREPO|nr:uncharacterized protein LOC127877802 [Dreissena polymorpha]XP_052280014.1 uncharacterized protein LOC127877802 [Dreissena polymorpha]KAH3839702.1 hypothetical protein DPMN_113135 [Dreissena polymorpha]
MHEEEVMNSETGMNTRDEVVSKSQTNADSIVDSLPCEDGHDDLPHTNPNRNVPSTSSQSKTLFRNIVQKHFVKSRLYYLVGDFLSSVEDEKQASLDLLDTFQKARKSTRDVIEATVDVKEARRKLKRRRKASNISLADRISLARRKSISIEKLSQDDEQCVENDVVVGILDLTLNEKQYPDEANKSDDSDQAHEKQPKKLSKRGRKYIYSETNEVTIRPHSVNNFNEHKDEINQGTKRRRSKSLPAGTHEKICAILQRDVDEKKYEIEKLVLNSILRLADDKMESISMSSRHGGLINEESDTLNENHVDCYKTVFDTSEGINKMATVEILTSSSDSEESGDDISVVGYDERRFSDSSDSSDKSDRSAKEDYEKHVREMQDHTTCIVVEDDEHEVDDGADNTNDSYSDDEDFEFKQLNDPKVYISTSEYRNSKPVLMLKPTLDAIAETSHESFNTLSHSDGRHSQTNNDIEFVASRKVNKRTLSNTGHEGKRFLSTNTETNTRRVNVTKPNTTTKSNRRPYDSVRDRNTNRVEHKTKHLMNNYVTQNTGRIKTPDKKKCISIDLLGFYEETKELHTVNSKRRHKQISTAVSTQNEQIVKEDVKTQTMAKRSPKRKRKLTRARKYDMTPLPPKTKPVPLPDLETIYLLNRSKTELTSSRSSTSSHETMESFKLLKERATDNRYRRPDFVLWTQLDLRKDFHSESHANGRLGVSMEKGNDRTSLVGYHVGRLPLKEAIKGVKSTSHVPEFREVPDRTPRSSRVEQIYVDLQRERRVTGGGEYRKLTASAREDSWF